MAYYLDQDDIHLVSSNAPVTCFRTVDPNIQDKPVPTDDPMYERYIPTLVQFRLSTNGVASVIDITIPYDNVLMEIEAAHAKVAWYDGQEWKLLDTTVDAVNQTLSTTSQAEGPIAVFLNDYWYSEVTQEIADSYPVWSYIRQSKESNGQRFFNFFAMSIERMKQEGLEIQSEKFIDQLNPKMIDWVYVYNLPVISSTDTVAFFDGTEPIPILNTLEEFFYNQQEGGGMIDYTNRRFYSRVNYANFNGEIQNYSVPVPFQSQGLPYNIWNPFDEFGTLLGVKRLYREGNADYRERIKDVFRYPANSGELGLINGIARELNMIKRVTWNDDTKNLYLKGQGIDPRTILVDDRPLTPHEYNVDAFQNVVIQALNQGKEHTVSFIQYVSSYELHDKENEALYQMMFEDDGQASPSLRKWVAYIKQVAPVMWGDFNWDEGYWDSISKELTGLGYVPNIWDSSIDVWKDYTFNPKRWEGKKIWQS